MSYIGNQPTSVAFITDQFNGTGSQTAFPMSVAPATPSAALVSISGVLQDPSTYSVSGLTLTFSAAPPSGTGNISVRYLGVPASSVLNTAYRTVTELTATAGQTTFTPASYTAGFINVYRNGVLLGSADYTATNGTTVVLGTACIAGELIAVESFYVSSVLNAIPATPGAVTSTYIQNGVALTSPTITGAVMSSMASSVITQYSGTAQNATGSSVNFTGLPSWVKRITLQINKVGFAAAGVAVVQIGSGSLTTTGYYSYTTLVDSTPGVTVTGYTNGFAAVNATAGSGTTVDTGAFVLTNMGGNTWTYTSHIQRVGDGGFNVGTGSITLGGTLDRISLVATTSTFNTGTVNILYE